MARARLSPFDALFLYWERPNQPTHFGEILVYEDRVEAEEVRENLRARIHLLPRYRQRAVFSPLSLAHPMWEDDPDFDVVNHVHELVLPAPGDNRVLSQEAGRLLTGCSTAGVRSGTSGCCKAMPAAARCCWFACTTPWSTGSRR